MMKIACLAMAGACVFFAGSALGAETPKAFVGVVTDTMCGSRPHANMMKDKTDAECVRLCVRGPQGYALFDGTTVMKLSDQNKPAKYAGRKVRVTGVYDEKSKTLKVASIEPANEN
jgi:hypothetical protein